MKTFVCNLILQLQLFPIFRKLWRCAPKRPSSRASSSPSATSTPSWPKGENLDLRQEYQLLLKLMFLFCCCYLLLLLLLLLLSLSLILAERRKFGPQVGISIFIVIDVFWCYLLLFWCCVVVVLLSQSKKEEIWTLGRNINHY